MMPKYDMLYTIKQLSAKDMERIFVRLWGQIFTSFYEEKSVKLCHFYKFQSLQSHMISLRTDMALPMLNKLQGDFLYSDKSLDIVMMERKELF